jgi:hypothetical protein
LAEAKRVHGTKYDYSEVVYSDAKTSVVIICPIHGAFRQAPFKHLRTGGCRKCVFEDFKGRYTQKYFEDFPEKKRLPATLYYVRFGRGKTSFYKVGITSTAVSQRFQLVKKADLNLTVLAEHKTTLNTAFRLEQEIQQQFGDASRYRPKIDEKLLRNVRLGPTECFLKPLPRTAVVKYFGS